MLLWKNCETDDSCSVGSKSLERFRSRFRFRVEHSIRKCLFTFWNFTCLKCNSIKCNSKSYNLKTELMRSTLSGFKGFPTELNCYLCFLTFQRKTCWPWRESWGLRTSEHSRKQHSCYLPVVHNVPCICWRRWCINHRHEVIVSGSNSFIQLFNQCVWGVLRYHVAWNQSRGVLR